MRTWKLLGLLFSLTFITFLFGNAAPPLPDLTIKDATAEEGLLLLAKTFDDSIYIDSTKINATYRITREFRDNDPRVKLPERQRFVLWMMDHKLTMLKRDEDYLFWAEPDVEEVWKTLTKSDVLRLQPPHIFESEFIRWMQNYLRENPQKANELSQPFSLDAAPEPMKEWLAAITFSKTGSPLDNYFPQLFTDSIWKNSYLTYCSPRVEQLPANTTVDNTWPFSMQAVVTEEYPPFLLKFSPVWGISGGAQLATRRTSLSAPKTPNGVISTRSLEIQVTVEGFRDLRLQEILKPNQTVPERIIESRPSLSKKEVPWQKIEGEAEVQKALAEIGATSDFHQSGKKALQLLAEIQHSASLAALPKDQILDKPISLEMKRQPLPVLMEELSQQSGAQIKLRGLSAEALAPLLITMRVQKRPLREVMLRIAHLYSIDWSKREEGKYEGSILDRDNWRVLLMQLGNIRYYRYRDWWNGVRQQQDEKLRGLVNRVWDKFGEEAITEPNSVRFADLPAELQSDIRREAEERIKFLEIRNQLNSYGQWRRAITYQVATQPLRFDILFDGQRHSTIALETPIDRLVERRNVMKARGINPQK